VNNDPYVYDGTQVLINRFSITDPTALRNLETDLTLITLADLDAQHLPGDYTLAHLQAFHRAIFECIYPWAGQIRTVAIGHTAWFCLPQYIQVNAEAIFTALAAESHLEDLPRDQFAQRAAWYLGEINALHPFRDGNGRAQRAFLAQLARDAGWPIDFTRMDPAENYAASKLAMEGDPTALARLLDKLTL